MTAKLPPLYCCACAAPLDDPYNPVAYGDCVVCEQFVCENCDAGHFPESGQSVCPSHADHPDAAGAEDRP
jgi:hypothetical protein